MTLLQQNLSFRRTTILFRSGILFMMLAFLCLCGQFTAYAATQPINSVTVKVKASLKAGQDLPKKIQLESSSASSGEVAVKAGATTYKVTAAEWVSGTGTELKSGQQPTMKVTLEPTDVSKHYFLASYRASNVSISKGTFVSAQRSGNKLILSFKLEAITGQYDAPSDIYWNDNKLGEIRWTRPDNTSGHYVVDLYRDKRKITSVESSSLSHNFYPYMNFSGSYTVKIKTVAYTDEQKKVAKDSKTIESTTLYIDDRNTSDGVGQVSETTDTSFVYGWYKQGDYWYYRYQTGLLQQNGWAKINQIWYLFDTQGRMLTGWQVSNGKYYYFLPSGAQYTGWLLNGDKWVYLVPEAELKAGESEGQLTTPGWRSINHLYYYFNADGTMYTGWLNDNGKYYYLNEQNNSLYGVMFTGWIHRNGVTYYCDESGAMVEGWKEIDGEWYYFYPGSGNMAINTYIGSYYVNNDGIWQH